MKADFDLMNSVYIIRYNNPVLVLSGRDITRSRIRVQVKGFKPFFFAPDKASTVLDLFGRPVRRVETRLPSDVAKLRKGFKFHDEADILFNVRYLVSKGIYVGCGIEDNKIVPAEELGVPPNILNLDLEVKSPPEKLPLPDNAIWPVVAIQFSNNYNDEIHLFLLDCPVDDIEIECKHRKRTDIIKPIIHHFSDERKLLVAAAMFVDEQDPDVLTAYNGNLFDFPYWKERSIKLEINVSMISRYNVFVAPLPKRDSTYFGETPYIKGRDVIDTYKAYIKWAQGKQGVQSERPWGVTYDFKSVVKHETGLDYVDYGDRIQYVHLHDPEKFVEYCTLDAYAMKLLEEYTQMISGHFDRLRRIAGAPIEWSQSNKKLIDAFALRISDVPLPSARRGLKKVKIKGATVAIPPIGVHRYVSIFDLKSLYPTLIQYYNLSPETKSIDGDIVVGDLRFKSFPEGILPKIARLWSEKREELREKGRLLLPSLEKDRTKQLETSYKYLLSSIYGVTAYPNFRLFDPDVARSITYLGRTCIERLDKVLRERNYKVIYADTDSVFVPMHTQNPDEVKFVELILNEELKRFADEFGAKNPPLIKFERLFKSILFKPKSGSEDPAKKRYAGWDGKNLYVIGLEPRSSAVPRVVRMKMLEWLKLILIEDDIEGGNKLIKDFWNELPYYPINEIAIPRGIKKERYVNEKTGKTRKNAWIDGRQYMRKHYGKVFREDKKVCLVYVREVMGKPGTEVIAITELDEELPPEIVVDWTKMRKTLIVKKFESLFTAVGLSLESVLTNKPVTKIMKPTKLEDFFNVHK